MNSKLTVGAVRQQAALAPSNERVVLVSKDPEVTALLSRLELVQCYPDTTDEHGNWGGTFKIEVAQITGR